VGVAAATPSNMFNGVSDFPMACANTSHGNKTQKKFDDGPSI
jgi:hypothetical protein